MEPRISHDDGIISITDASTTIAYCRYDESGAIEYLFVGTRFRRCGHARRALAIVEERLGKKLFFKPPLSPLGRLVVESYGRGTGPGQVRPCGVSGDGRERVRT